MRQITYLVLSLVKVCILSLLLVFAFKMIVGFEDKFESKFILYIVGILCTLLISLMIFVQTIIAMLIFDFTKVRIQKVIRLNWLIGLV